MDRMHIAWKDGTAFEASDASGHAVRMDLSPEEGGQGTGFSAMQLVLTALGGCMGVSVQLLLLKMKNPFTSIELEVHGFPTGTVPKTYEQIDLLIRVQADGLTQDKLDRIIHLAEEKSCNISAILQPVTRIRTIGMLV